MGMQSALKMDDMKKRLDDSLKKIRWRRLWEVGKEDPRRVIHAFKVGLALTLVSLLYLMEPLFEGIGENTMWAVLTVVVVLQFTAGATLCKGLNRGFGTLLAGSLSFLVEYIASRSGSVFHGIFIGAAVFVIGFAATYIRFFPSIKRNYDYGVLVFLLTFDLITVSSYRVDNVLTIAHERFYTIAIGCGVCLVMSLFIFPIWSGDDLHKSTIWKIEGLARSIEACAGDYFSDNDPNKPEDTSLDELIYEGYKAVVDSKSIDKTLALYSSWEPRHSRKCQKVPWQQYVKLGSVLRHFGYTVVALHGCLQTEIQTPLSIRLMFKDPCTRLAGEVSRALIELADCIRNRRICSTEILSDNLQQALHDLNAAFKSQPRLFLGNNNNPSTPRFVKTESKKGDGTNSDGVVQPTETEKKVLRHTLSKIVITSLEFSEALPFSAFASLLVEAVARLDLVIEEVEELGNVANFKECIRAPGDQVINVAMSKRSCSHIDLPSQGVD